MANKNKYATALTAADYFKNKNIIGKEIDQRTYELRKKNRKYLTDSNEANFYDSLTNTTYNTQTRQREQKEVQQDNNWVNKNGSVLGTAGDIGRNLLKGFISTGESLGDLASYIIAGGADILGFDQYAKDVREGAALSLTDASERYLDKQTGGLITKINNNSWTGDKLDSVFESIGQSYGSAKLGSLFKNNGNWTIGVGKYSMNMPVSSIITGFSNGMTEAYNKGGNNWQALVKGITGGLTEGFSEGLFGVFGQGGSSMEDAIMSKLTRGLESKVARQLAKTGIQAIGEGAEEVISYMMNWAADNFQDLVAEQMGYNLEQMGDKFDVNELWENFVAGAISGGLSSGASTIATNIKAARGNQNAQFNLKYEQAQHDIEKKFGKALNDTQQEQLEGILKQADSMGVELTTDEIIDKFDQNEKSEKLVVDTLVEEATKEGMSEEEIASIRNQVEQDLEDGKLDVEKIKQILGGESYNKLKEALNLQSEINDLKSQLNNELNTETMNQSLQEQITDKENQLKEYDIDNIRKEIQYTSLTKFDSKSKLMNSFMETAKKSQSLSLNENDYKDQRAKDIITKAKAANYNDTTETRQFIENLINISTSLKTNGDKLNYDFTSNEILKQKGQYQKGKTINGYVVGNNIVLNVDAAKALNKVVGHEVTHLFEETTEYQAYKELIKKVAEENGEWESRYKDLEKLYSKQFKNLTDEQKQTKIENELIADLTGDYLFTDQEFLNTLYKDNRKWYQKIYDFVTELLGIVDKNTKFHKELEQAKTNLDKAKVAYRQMYKTTEAQTSEELKQKLTDLGIEFREYDPEIEGSREEFINYYDDLKFSLSNNTDIAPYNRDMLVQEQRSSINDRLNDLQDQIDELRVADVTPVAEEYQNTTVNEEELFNQMYSEQPLDESYIPSESETYEPITELSDSNIDKITRNLMKTLKIKNSERQNVRNAIKELSNRENLSVNDVRDFIQEYYDNTVTIQLTDVQEAKSDLSTYKIKVPDNIKSEFGGEYSKLRDKMNGKLNMRESGMDIDVAYQELSKNYPDFFPEDIYSQADQLNRMLDVATLDSKEVVQDLDDFALNEILLEEADNIYSSIAGYKYDQRVQEAEEYYKQIGKDVEKGIIEPTESVVENELEDLPISQQEDVQVEHLSRAVRNLRSVNNQIDKYQRLFNEANEKLEKYQRDIDKINNELTVNPFEQQLNEMLIKDIESKSAQYVEKYDRYSQKLQELTEKKNQLENEIANTPEKVARKQIQQALIDKAGVTNLDLSDINTISSLMMNNTDPLRLQRMLFGDEIGEILNDQVFQKVKDNESESIRWQNAERDGLRALGKFTKEESAAIQKYGEKVEVDDRGIEHHYGDNELKRDIQDASKREQIKKAAEYIRNKYDEYIDMANKVLTQLGYDPIHKRTDYMRHFQEVSDKFSQIGVPLNRNSLNENNIPTDINGLTSDFAPSKQFFASADLHRTGTKTSYDALKGIDGYISGIANVIYHTEDINRLRGLESFVRDTYGTEHGYDGIENLTDEQRAKRVQAIQENKLSNYASWLHEYTNQLAGKKSMVDRGVEALFGRKAYSILNTSSSQVATNMTGFNLSSAMTNFISYFQALAKTNKIAAAKAMVDSVKNIFQDDGFVNKNNFLTSRYGTDMVSKNLWQKIQSAGGIFMEGTDHFVSNMIVRGKYNELKAKGMSDTEAHIEAGKFASNILGDRSKGAMPTLYGSKVAKILTTFQYEANNQLYSMFYDTFHDGKDATRKSVKSTASSVFMLGEMIAFTHLFGKAFESITGYNPTLDLWEAIAKLFGFDDDDESEDTIIDNIQQSVSEIIDGLPYISTLTGGGRIPVSEAFNGVTGLFQSKDEYGNDKTTKDYVNDLLGSGSYWVLPTGYGQLKKTYKGANLYYDLDPFSDDFGKKREIAGSYTDSGNLRFQAKEDTGTVLKNLLFGQWSSQEAQDYIDSGFKTTKKKDLEKAQSYNLDLNEFTEYNNGLKEQTKQSDKINYIMSTDYDSDTKEKMIKDATKKDVDVDKYNTYEEFDYATKHERKYNIGTSIMDFNEFYSIDNDIAEVKANTSQDKQETFNYINNLNISNVSKGILKKMYYKTYKSQDKEIINYINGMGNTYAQKVKLFEDLGFTVKDGYVY